jgi:acyl-[acyl-carrier-protein]-phospholipid O-acyltransferase/long-chain-fatty-acid--[acyl-carrier-protein] ligase
MAILPMFHSFGYTGTLWTILSMDPKGVYHYNPLDARQIGQLCRRHRATILVATPTFLRPYLKRCQAEDLATLEVVFVGAEKLPAALADAFEEKFGVRPYEGYGATELSPIAAGSVPAGRGPGAAKQGARPDTVGRPLPGVEAKIVDLETGTDLGIDKPGMLLIRGPNVMKGYLEQPEATAQVIRDGWYVTGDMATIDADGFIRITDRLSRFSKIGGEMVPHLRVEEAILAALADIEDPRPLAVTGVPDSRKGERLIVVHTGLGKPVAQIVKEMAQAGLPPLWIPSPDSFLQVDELPLLGTGKLDLRKLKQIAAEKIADAAPHERPEGK